MIFDAMRATGAAALIVLAMSQSVLLQHAGPVVAMQAQTQMLPSMVEGSVEAHAVTWIREAGCWGIIALVLFFYRRDYANGVDYWRAQNLVMVDLVKESTKAQTTMNAIMAENTVVTHGLKDLIRQFERRENERHEQGHRKS